MTDPKPPQRKPQRDEPISGGPHHDPQWKLVPSPAPPLRGGGMVVDTSSKKPNRDFADELLAQAREALKREKAGGVQREQERTRTRERDKGGGT